MRRLSSWAQVRELGVGAHGQVLLALDNLTGQQVALKFVKRGPDVSENCWSDQAPGWGLAGNRGGMAERRVGRPTCRRRAACCPCHCSPWPWPPRS
jgi:hypothetical protein